jgi:hypothetical protein
VAAALTSARKGARTLLIERQLKLGGMGSNAPVHTFCGLFHPDVSSGPQWLNPGIPTEIGERLLEMTSQHEPELMGRVFVLRHHPSMFAALAKQLCDAEPLLTVWTGTELVALKRESDLWHFAAYRTDGLAKATATSAIDTTGDATLARLLGKEHWNTAPASRLYRPAFVCCFSGVTEQLDDQARLQIAKILVNSVRQGRLPVGALAVTFRQAPTDDGDIFMTIDMPADGAAWDSLDTATRNRLEAEGAELARAIWRHLRAEHPIFANSDEAVMPTHAGVRESARWIGDHVLTAAELMSSRRFKNEAALVGWPLEMGEDAQGPKFLYFDTPQPASIPVDALQSRQVPNMFFAGRCVSCDHEALASMRVMGTCLATGQAAGRLASAKTDGR